MKQIYLLSQKKKKWYKDHFVQNFRWWNENIWFGPSLCQKRLHIQNMCK